MVIVPEGRRALKLEDLPPGEVIGRLQKLLQYAARKADEHKLCRERQSGEAQRSTELEGELREANEALANQRAHCDAQADECVTLRKAIVELERRCAGLESELQAAATHEVASAESAVLTAALEEEQERRRGLEAAALKFESEILDLRAAVIEASSLSQENLQRALAAESACEAMRAAVAEQERQLGEFRELCSVLESQCAVLKIDACKAVEEREAALRREAESDTLHAELAAARQLLLEYEQKFRDSETERDRLNESVGWVRSEYELLESELSSLKASFAEAVDERSRLEDALGNLRGQIDAGKAIEGELTSVQQHLEESESRLQLALAERDQARSYLEQLREDYELLESEWAAARESMAESLTRRDAGKSEAQPPELEATEGNQEADEAVQSDESEGLATGPDEDRADDDGVPDCATKRPWAILPGELGAGGGHKLLVMDNAVLGKAMQHMEKEAFVERWHREAEVQGASQAQFRLGVRYEKGLGVTQNLAEALRWLVRAAEQGHTGAQYHLGRMYADGRGVLKNPTMALDWFRKAAEQGDAASQCELGVLCITGTGVSRDPEAAVAWFRKSAEQGNPAALFHLGVLYIDGVSVPSNPVLAFDYFQRAAEQGHADAQHRVGQMLSEGIIVTRDECRALDWFSKAAEQGHPQAQFALGMCLERGRGAVQNYIRAYAWYNLAAVRLDQARAARDRLATLMAPEQILQGQQLAEEMHIKSQADEQESR